MAYKSAFHTITPTTDTLHIIDMVETDWLNPNIQTRKGGGGGGSSSEDEQSVQWKAYLHIRQRQDVIDATTTTDEPSIMNEERIWQLYSVLCFFYNFNMQFELEDECQYPGIKCDDVYDKSDVMYPSSEDLRVVSITLPNESLTGTISVELMLLSHLETLDLSNNYISGMLPRYFSKEQLNSLKVLSLHDNRFEGSIPKEMAGLIHLQKVQSGLICDSVVYLVGF